MVSLQFLKCSTSTMTEGYVMDVEMPWSFTRIQEDSGIPWHGKENLRFKRGLFRRDNELSDDKLNCVR
jgi:hypothetical protein